MENPNLVAIAVFVIGAPIFSFFASLLRLFGEDTPSAARAFFLLATLCSAPMIAFFIGAALSPNGEVAFVGGHLMIFLGPIAALLAVIFFLIARGKVIGWKKDALALGISIGFGALAYVLAAANS